MKKATVRVPHHWLDPEMQVTVVSAVASDELFMTSGGDCLMRGARKMPLRGDVPHEDLIMAIAPQPYEHIVAGIAFLAPEPTDIDVAEAMVERYELAVENPLMAMNRNGIAGVVLELAKLTKLRYTTELVLVEE